MRENEGLENLITFPRIFTSVIDDYKQNWIQLG